MNPAYPDSLMLNGGSFTTVNKKQIANNIIIIDLFATSRNVAD